MPRSHAFALADLAAPQRYKLLSALVIPRPIAFVTSCSRDGIVNAAPFSFFNLFSEDPALVVLGIQGRRDGTPKDTVANVRATGAFIVHLVDEDLAERMNLAAVDFPPDWSEPEMAGLATLPGSAVDVPRLEAAPAALECRRFAVMNVGLNRDLVLGEVVHVHVREGLIDPATLHVDLAAYHPVGRLFANLYARQRDRFEIVRETFEAWQARTGR